MSLTLEIKPADGPELRTRLTPGRNRLSVRVGDTFRIYDDQTGLAPKGISVRRVDNSLIVDGLGTADGTNAPVIVEFAEFYTLCSAGSPCQLVIDPGAGGTPVATITPGTPPIGALADGGFVLYDPQFTAPEVAPVASSSIDTRTVLYGTGGLLIAGAAAAGGGGGGDGGGGGGPVAGGGGADPTLKLSSSTTFSDRTPVIHGEGEPGTRILVRIDTNGDGSADVTYATTVGADNRWAIDLATATPESGALPSTGLPDHATVGITQSGGAGGNVNLPPITLSFDGVPPAAPTIHIVAGDDIVNTAEKTGGIIVTGTAEAGATVLLDWGGHAATAAVDAEGQWQTVFAATEVPNDGPQTLSVLVRDPAGNLGPAATRTVLVDTGSARLVLGVIAGGDGRVTVADGNSVGFSGSADPDAAVTVGWNGLSHVTTAAADGTWATTFTGAEVPQANGTDFGYTITAVNARGNLASANGSLLVDRQPPAAPTFAPITGDNRVSVAERADGVAVSGQSEAGATLVISWAGVSRSATAGADGRWSVRYGAGELPVVASPGQNTTVTAVATDTAGNQGATASQTVFIEQPFAPPTIGLVAGDDVVSAAERAANIVISGTVQAGAPGVTVTWGSFSGAAAITGTTWRITVPAARVPGDGDVAVNAAITGSPGQATSRPVHIDVTAPTAPVIGVVESDDRVTLAERADGVVISGTAEANARIAVSWGGHAASTVANGSGAWSVSYAAGDVPTVPTGGGNVNVTATATDAAGNTSAAAQRAVRIDAPFAAPTINVVEGNDIVNAAERADGVVLSGGAPAGATAIAVDWGSFHGTATVAGGSWSLNVPAGQVPGNGNTSLTAAVAGDSANAVATRAVVVDVTPPPAPVVAPVTGNDSIDMTERIGFTISGTAEANATVMVSLGTASRTAQADAVGNWATTPFTSGDVPLGPTTITLSALATDRAGNTGTATSRQITIEALPSAVATPASLGLEDPLHPILGA